MAYDRSGNKITTADLEVDGAMTAWMVDSLNPTLIQTLEGQPVFVHAGPFANIAIGQSSIIADQIGTRLSDYLVTESGFGADIGYRKVLEPEVPFLRAEARRGGDRGHRPRPQDARGRAPRSRPACPSTRCTSEEDLGLLEKGCENLVAHIDIVRHSGVRPVVCMNRFHTDTPAEMALVRRIAEEQGALCARSEHWLKGGEGAIELAEAVEAPARKSNEFGSSTTSTPRCAAGSRPSPRRCTAPTA